MGIEANTVEIKQTNTYGALLAVAHDQFGTKVHYWFDIEGHEAIHCEEVVYYGTNGRHIVPPKKMSVPDRVVEAVQAEGYQVKGVDTL